MSKEITTPVNAEVDFEVNEKIKTKLALQKKLDEKPIDRKRYLGIMIEERFELDKALQNKKMSFKELIHFLNKR